MMNIVRLGPGDEARAQAMFVMMAEVFEEPCELVTDEYLRRLLARPDFWAIAAFEGPEGSEVVGGVTAYTLPMTRGEYAELFLYDLAVRSDRQRLGIGRALVTSLREQGASAGIELSFVAADNEDDGAIEFYRAIGGVESAVTFFTFSTPDPT